MSVLGSLLVLCAVLTWPGGRAREAVRARWQHLVVRGGPGQPPAGPRARLVGLMSRLGLRTGRPDTGAGDWLPVLDNLAAALRVGLPPAEALQLATRGAPTHVRSTVEAVLVASRDGRQCGPAWARAAREADRREVHLLARSWAISEQLGAPLADAVDSAARSARSQRELSSRLATATAGARTTATILSLLPVVGVGVALLMGIGPADLYGSPAALMSLAAGLLLLGGGRAVVNGMVARVSEPG